MDRSLGNLFRYPELSAGQPLHDLGWQSFPALIGLILFSSFAAIYIRRVPVARVFAVAYSLMNPYFAVMMCLLSVMAINGVQTWWGATLKKNGRSYG
jgi:hypothetical protein